MAGCGDVLSLEDLQTAKKHQIFEAEVITGKQGGVASGADIDYATNPVTGQVQKTLPAVLRDAGFRPAPFTFATGGMLAVGDSDMAVLWPISAGGDGQYYLWKGAYPKTIPASSTPASTGGISSSAWFPLGDITIKQAIDKAFNGNKMCFVEAWGDDTTAHVGSAVYPFKTIAAAIAASSGPTTIRIGEGLFTWGGTLRNNLSFVGSGQPTVDAGATTLVGGTRLQSDDSGGFPGGFTGMTGISFDNLGVLAKGKTNGLQITSPGNTAVGKNISVSNITVLCDPTTDHAMLLENLQYLNVKNITTYGGVSGCAIKALDFTVSNAVHYDASGAGLTLRESPYAKCKRGVVDTVRVDRYVSTTNASTAVQLLNNEESAAMRDISISNVLCNAANTALFINGQNNTIAAELISVADVTALQTTTFAIYIAGNIKSAAVRGISTYNCVAIANIEAFGAYAPTDTLLSGFNDNAGAQSAVRPILNQGVRTTVSGFKTNLTGMNIYTPVVENPGVGTVIAGFNYTGTSIIDTGSGDHTVIEGEDLQGVPTGASTPGTCTAIKRANGLMTVNVINAIVIGASTDIALPANMRFKVGNVATPAQIRQNYNIKISYYVNAATPITVNMTVLAFPLTESTFRVLLAGDPSAISTGAVISAELSGIWK